MSLGYGCCLARRYVLVSASSDSSIRMNYIRGSLALGTVDDY